MNTHESFRGTPQPSAWSTEIKNDSRFTIPVSVKQDVKRNLLNMDVSTESLGILSLEDMKPTKDTMTTLGLHNSMSASTTSGMTSNISLSNSMAERQRVLENTRALLEKYNNRKNNSVLSESTVNESDLRESSNLCTPSKCSNSTINESDLLNQKSKINLTQHDANKSLVSTVSSSESFSAQINDLMEKFEANPSDTLSDIFGNQSKQSLEFDSGMFQPAEDMKEQFEQDEQAWRMKYGALPNSSKQLEFTHNSPQTYESSESHGFDEKMSVGEYFNQRNNHWSVLNKTNSRLNITPTGLLNSTAIDDDLNAKSMNSDCKLSQNDLSAINQSTANANTSLMSLSDIQNLIMGEENTPSKVLERLLSAPLQTKSTNVSNTFGKLQGLNEKKGNSSKAQPVLLKDGYYHSRSSLGSPSLNSESKFPKYASTADLRTPVKESLASSTKIYSTKSMGNIHDNDKENMMSPRRLEEKNRSLNSCRSTSSMESIPDGMMKLSSTKSELVFDCVKEGRSVQQEVTIRNKNNRRVKYMIQTNNSNFKVTNRDLQGDKASILLHPLETRQLYITYSPNAIGPQTGSLMFTPFKHKEEQVHLRQVIAMYAYGGHVNIQIKGQTRDLTGKLWISLGSLDGRQELCADFLISNTGTIDGFVCLTVNSKSPCAYNDISLSPSKVVIKSGTQINVRVRFRPSKNDLQLLNLALGNKSMKSSEIAAIRMISGADINRQRINKIYKKFTKEKLEGLGSSLVKQLNAQYQYAQPGDEIRVFNESGKSVECLMQTLDCTEICLLVDRDMDATLMADADESTVFFKTMIGPDESSLVDHISDQSYLKPFNVEPNKVILTPPNKKFDYLFLSTNYDRPVGFNIRVTPDSPIHVVPSSGEVRPGDILKVRVECDYLVTVARQDFDVIFEIEDDVLKVIVSVWNL